MLENKRTTPLKGWLIWSCAVLFYFYEFMIQVSPGVMSKDLMKTFDISALSLGNLSAYYFYSYAAMQLVVGLALDRMGPRKLITISSLICALGCFWFGSATTLQHAEISRLIIGIGSACAVVSAFKLATKWFDKKLFGIVTGLTVAVGMMGAVFGEVPLAWLVETIGWRLVMSVFAIAGLIISVLVYTVIRDTPQPEITDLQKSNLRQSLKNVLSCKQTWLTAVYGGLMFAPTTALGSLWGVSWMSNYYGFERAESAHIISFLFFGWAFGSPLSGVLTNYFGRCKVTMLYGSLSTFAILMSLIFCQTWSSTSLMILWFLFGLSSSGFLPFMTIIKGLHPKNDTGVAMGFGNAMNMVGGALLQPLIGFVLDYTWGGEMSDGIRVYSSQSYQLSLMIIPVLILVSVYVLSRIKENFNSEAMIDPKIDNTPNAAVANAV